MFHRFRLFVLILALVYSADVATTADYEAFGAQFRYLTIWALTGNMIAAAAVLLPGLGRADARGDLALSVLAILNALVVFSYWKLFFVDPSLVNGDNVPKAYREYYLHAAGPALMWVDFLWLKRGFRNVLPVVLWLAVAVLVYVGWAEGLVAPRNDTPVGAVTTGLPYPFLNDMPWQARAMFYASIFGTGVAFAVVFFVVSWVGRRIWPV